jgi:hypothetical protein
MLEYSKEQAITEKQSRQDNLRHASENTKHY